MPDHLHRLVAHMRWADSRVLEALRSTPALDPKTLELYAHVLGAEHVWLARLGGRLPTIAVWPSLSLAECAALASETHAGYSTLLDALSPEDLGRSVSYRNSAGAQFTSTIEDMVLHVAMHGSYHRGQIAAALRRQNATPLPTDYIAFVRGAPAATRTPG
jgi:uncharacterized damage-inducible protein DinB